MRIIIVGAGMVGSSLAEQLIKEGHDIAIIEKNPEMCRQIEEKIDVFIIEGLGVSPRNLETAGIRDADMVLAVTPEDETNILVCAIAQQYGVNTRIARLRSEEFMDSDLGFNLQSLGITRRIDPEKTVVDSIMQYLMTPNALEASSFMDGKVLLREYRVTKEMPVMGKSLMEIRQMTHMSQILVMTVLRNDKAIIPTGDLVVEENDDVLVLFPATSLDAFLDLVNLVGRKTRRVIIAGGSLLAFRLAQDLEKWIDRVIYIDPDMDHGRWVSEHLDRTEVMHGDCTELSIFKEVNAENADFFVGAGRSTENNVMAALLAKAQKVREVIAVCDQPVKNNTLFKSIGIDHVINPRITTAASILDVIHRGRILSEIRLKDMDLEAIRIKPGQNSRVLAGPVSQVWVPLSKKAIVGAIIRGDQVIVPEGNTQIEEDDQVIVVTRAKTVDDLKRLFRERL